AAGAVLLLGGTSVWAGSRGGTAALAIGTALTIGLTIFVRRRFEGKRLEALVIGICVAASAGMVGLATSEFARSDLASADYGKFAIVKSALTLVPSYPIFGAGRGSFETIFPAVHSGTRY